MTDSDGDGGSDATPRRARTRRPQPKPRRKNSDIAGVLDSDTAAVVAGDNCASPRSNEVVSPGGTSLRHRTISEEDSFFVRVNKARHVVNLEDDDDTIGKKDVFIDQDVIGKRSDGLSLTLRERKKKDASGDVEKRRRKDAAQDDTALPDMTFTDEEECTTTLNEASSRQRKDEDSPSPSKKARLADASSSSDEDILVVVGNTSRDERRKRIAEQTAAILAKSGADKAIVDLDQLSSDVIDTEGVTEAGIDGLDEELARAVAAAYNAEAEAEAKVNLGAEGGRTSPRRVIREKIKLTMQGAIHPLAVLHPKTARIWATFQRPVQFVVYADMTFGTMATKFRTLKQQELQQEHVEHAEKLPELVLAWQGTRLFPSSTPRSLGWRANGTSDTKTWTVEAYTPDAFNEVCRRKNVERERRMKQLLEDNVEEEDGDGPKEGEKEDERAIRLKIRTKQDVKPWHFVMLKSKTVGELITSFRRVAKVPEGARVRLRNDGETLLEGAVVDALGLEDEDELDAIIG